MKTKTKPNKKINYEVKRNNYVGLLFFSLVLVSALYIIKSQTETFKEIEPTHKDLLNPEVEIVEIEKETKEIENLRKYLNPGDLNTFKIYQSSYIYQETVKSSDINEESMLYIAYKYLENTSNFSKYTKIITCDEATKINIDQNIYQCGGNKYNTSYYRVNTYITKELLKDTIQTIFNRNITKFKNFYTSEDNLCYYVDNDYICVSHKTEHPPTKTETEFIKAYKYTNKITIIEKYRHSKNGIYYKGFNSNEVGEEYYISTFNKRNGKYYWSSTKIYQEN